MKTAKTRRRLAPSEKYEIFVQVLTGQATQREAADRYGVDRSNSAAHREDGEAGRPGRVGRVGARAGRADRVAAALAQARAELERLRATVTEQAVALHLQEGNRAGTDHRHGPGSCAR